MKIKINGTGHTKFGKDNRDIGEIMLDACMQATQYISIDAVDAIYISNFSSEFIHQCHLPAVLSSKIKKEKEISRVESACAGGGLAIKEAAIAIHSGLYTNVLVLGVEKMTKTPSEQATQIISQAASDVERAHGATFPALYALMASRYFHEYQATEEHLAQIAVKNHTNALLNPNAQFHKAISIDDVLRSGYIAKPLKKLDCSPISDGASSILLSSSEIKIEGYEREPVYLTGIGHSVDCIELYNRKSLTQMSSVIHASKKAFQMAGLSPDTIDIAELHDCFTIAELIQMEDIGFCERGKGKDIVENKLSEINGEIPVNTSGGLKAKGHPIGATGISQVVEIVKQLQGDADKRQVQDVETGLCCNIGGTGGSAVVSIFSR